MPRQVVAGSGEGVVVVGRMLIASFDVPADGAPVGRARIFVDRIGFRRVDLVLVDDAPFDAGVLDADLFRSRERLERVQHGAGVVLPVPGIGRVFGQAFQGVEGMSAASTGNLPRGLLKDAGGDRECRVAVRTLCVH